MQWVRVRRGGNDGPGSTWLVRAAKPAALLRAAGLPVLTMDLNRRER
ncbi:MAG: hypothetical protein ACKVU4_05800 [Phycisphaerales bacterium]